MQEYLLGVAERIMETSVESSIYLKYKELKACLMKKNGLEMRCEETKNTADEISLQSWVIKLSQQLQTCLKAEPPIMSLCKSLRISPVPRVEQEIEKINQKINYLLEKKGREAKCQVWEENQWLIEKMEGLIEENRILRRMVGR